MPREHSPYDINIDEDPPFYHVTFSPPEKQARRTPGEVTSYLPKHECWIRREAGRLKCASWRFDHQMGELHSETKQELERLAMQAVETWIREAAGGSYTQPQEHLPRRG